MPGMQMSEIWKYLSYCTLGKGLVEASPSSQQTQHTESGAMSELHRWHHRYPENKITQWYFIQQHN
jgi:chlorite dismutase